MPNGFYRVKFYRPFKERWFSVCVISGAPRFAVADDSEEIPWEDLAAWKGEWMDAMLVTRDWDSI